MPKKLPARPSLEHLKSQAKDLLEAFRRKDPEAVERFRDGLPALKGADIEQVAATKLALHDAQSVIAREYGFASFAELRADVEGVPPSPELLSALMDPHVAVLPGAVRAAMTAAMSERDVLGARRTALPSLLPLLPVRNAVLAVGALAPLNIGRPASRAAIAAARDGDRLLAVFAQKEDASEAPGEADLHPVGCAARLVAEIATPEHGSWIVVRGLRWIRMESIERSEPCVMARTVSFDVDERPSAETARLEQALRDRVRTFAAQLPDARHLVEMTERMGVLELADLTVANLRCSVQDKARYAAAPTLAARLALVLSFFDQAA